jgi:hypothetical protein
MASILGCFISEEFKFLFVHSNFRNIKDSMAQFIYRYSYSKVLIIGNGFDLDMGLQSSWKHFVDSQEFTQIANANKLAFYLKKKRDLKNWIDIEGELKTYSLDNRIDHSDYHANYFELINVLSDYLKKVIYPVSENSSISYKLLNKFFADNQETESILIIDFNYTDTIKLFADLVNVELNTNRNSRIHHVRVHGSLDQNNIVVGVSDGDDINLDHSFIRKSYHDASNLNDFGNVLKQSQNVLFFGHSLGKSDYHYFRDFFHTVLDEKASKIVLGNKKRNLTFFHKDEISKISLFTNLDELTGGNMKVLKNINVFNQYQTSSLNELPF